MRMCRVVGYLGEPVAIEDLLYRPAGSLVRQAVQPQRMSLLNLGGFGFAAWAPGTRCPDQPLTYRVATIPTFDRNLRAVARQLEAGALVAHVRGVVYDEHERVGAQNVHPFRFEGATIALAQNGDLHDFARMRGDLLAEIDPELAGMIEGNHGQ
jgi:glutamine amidotransferase